MCDFILSHVFHFSSGIVISPEYRRISLIVECIVILIVSFLMFSDLYLHSFNYCGEAFCVFLLVERYLLSAWWYLGVLIILRCILCIFNYTHLYPCYKLYAVNVVLFFSCFYFFVLSFCGNGTYAFFFSVLCVYY